MNGQQVSNLCQLLDSLSWVVDERIQELAGINEDDYTHFYRLHFQDKMDLSIILKMYRNSWGEDLTKNTVVMPSGPTMRYQIKFAFWFNYIAMLFSIITMLYNHMTVLQCYMTIYWLVCCQLEKIWTYSILLYLLSLTALDQQSGDSCSILPAVKQ